MKSSFSAAGWEEVYKSLDHSLLHAVCCVHIFTTQYTPGVGGIDKYSTSVFLEKILRYNYIPTIGVADLQAPLNNMLQSS